jgi:hypothetical protein
VSKKAAGEAACNTMSAMLLVMPQRALNLPYARWSVAALFVYVAFGSAFDGRPPRPLGTLIAGWVLAVVSAAFALSTTFYLRARGDELLVLTIYKRSSLVLSRTCFASVGVGRGRARSWVLTVSDANVKRRLRTYYLFDGIAQLAVRRLEKRLLPT